MRVVEQRAGSSDSRRRGTPPPLACTATRVLLAVALAGLLLLPRAAQGVADAGAATVGTAAAHDCPQHERGGSILDLPDTSDCRRLLRLMAGCLPSWHAATVSVEPGSGCCAHAAAFFELRCHCWSSQFDGAVVAGVGAVDDACSPGGAVDDASALARQQQQGRGQPRSEAREQAQSDGGAGQAQDGGAQQQQQGSRQPIRLKGGGGPEPPRVYVGVLSAAARRDARDAIRATWGAHPGLHRTRFFLARPADDALFEAVRAEAVQKRDVVVLGHVTEHYTNISHQTLEVMRLAAADPAASHALKADDDSYVHVGRLLARLAQLPRERLFWGNIEDPGGAPHREPGHDWFVSREEWPAERYPPWAHGAGYVLSADLAAEVASGAAYAASVGGHLFKFEDVALASWLEWAAVRGGWRVHAVADKRFNYGGCRQGDLVSHYIRPAQQRCMWAQGGRCRGC